LLSWNLNKPHSDLSQEVEPICDTKMVVICCARTLTTLWAECVENYQVNDICFSPGGSGSVRQPWHLYVFTQRSINKLTLANKGDYCTGVGTPEVPFCSGCSFATF